MVDVRKRHSREKAPKLRPSAGLAEQGRKAASRKAATTLIKIERAKRAIELDLERYGGLYPYAEGRLTAEEVLRRAGLDRALLQKPRHKDLKGKVNDWLKAIKEKQLKGKKVIRKAVTERVDNAEDKTDLIRQQWVQAELEFVEQANEIARLNRRCAELEEEIRGLRSAM
ncbi:hypothetical protein [Aminobacter carboxidus]|uniref:Uncharacterized protein n=1 Tax=Aminobacter carboxidus TaxID=376165 RepID=A0ABR9GJ36_9HYPH|nr:hypothetical protein [Aminobacter carboxidus]MBE1203683.1 hypothetical protein [Aminobacter carboxidus]